MSTIILLDAGPLGMLANPKATATTSQCLTWLEQLLVKGARVLIPEIADYEVRRELLRAKKNASITRLDNLKQTLPYEPLSTPVMLKAAEFWARMRQQGQPTADSKALDADVILAAQAALLGQQGDRVVIATTNVGHLSRMVPAYLWQEMG